MISPTIDQHFENALQETHKYPLEASNVSIYYNQFRAVKEINLQIEPCKITAFIGPSGCGKSTMIRAFNRMNDFISGCRLTGSIIFQGHDLYLKDEDPVLIRRKIGMVFQKPNPFPKSIYENIAWGAKVNGIAGDMDDLVEKALKGAALWDEVKHDLKKNALELSGGQQQRLCIARTIVVNPEIILMDEPCSALDPAATLKIEDLMRELSKKYTIVIVTHNMQQAGRASDFTAFFNMDEDRAGVMVEYGETSQIFTNPHDKRTEDYITGRFG
jgi:phosphate transport system ATP-binding protein